VTAIIGQDQAQASRLALIWIPAFRVTNLIDDSMDPVAAAHPITGGGAPAAPPMTMFWDVPGFGHAVYTTT
jgi:hypothetical protein